MASIIDIVKAKIDIVEEIGLVVALQKSGKSLKGLCPFHNERTPSFYVFAESQTWHCFGCNEGGDVFSFVQKQQGLEFREALLYLAEKAGVEVEEHGGPSPEEAREISAAKERLRKLNEDALLWFHQMLLRAKEATEARAYVQSRGISADTVIGFGLGYAPDHWDALTHYLQGQGYSQQELVSGGLARERNSQESEGREGGVYDYFRNRLIFPIRDIRGRVIGFGGRALGDGKPKYLNSPQTLLFEKNSVLYAIDMAKDAIKDAGQVVIVEGYVDAVIAHQYGTKQTVACIGSAITEKHIQQLKKMTRQVTLALDPDAAGSAATELGIQEALKTFDRTVVPVPLAAERTERQRSGQGKHKQQVRGIIRLEEQVDAEINVLQLPAGEDPDEVIKRDFSAWLYAVTHPLPLVDYYFVVKTAELNLREPAGKTEAARRLLPVIGMISDRIKRDAYIRKLAGMISIDERSLYEELQKVLKGQKANGVTAAFSAPMGQQAAGKSGPLGGWNAAAQSVKSEVSAGSKDGEKEAQSALEGSGQGPSIRLDRNRDNRLQWEDYLIGLLLQNPGLSQNVCGIINDGDFAGTDTRELYRILNSVYQQRASSPSHQPFEQHVPSALLATVARAQKCVESRYPRDGEPVKEAIQCATRLKRTRLLQLNTELKYLIHEAAEAGDSVAVRQFLLQVSQIERQLRTINTAMRLHG
ncbi:DNA primase [Ktedonosporobacter rubrisoli]|uniref:DNA primase n=1 Tax=Ktedonosporobacter rubrisoli TaxID=2509675 RepID=A0A4P6JZ35_KTERU|nr:DNA primase [Ktedonosporobacter rubrisoli]QBD80346.1 DNA primase [Ktedonosporobacter rubrisoli]